MQLSLTSPGSAVARVGDVLYAVTPTSAHAPEGAAAGRKIAEAVRGGIEPGLRDALRIAISGHCQALADLPVARAEADQVLRVLQSSDTGRVTAEIADVSVQLMLLRVADVESAQPQTGYPLLERIEAYDEKHGTAYLETLRVHLSSFGDSTVASARLGIHTNTLRYRLRRLSELFTVNLADEDERLGLMLQFRLSRG
jgi:DNA-binding PucR family transcriptional regulator